MTTEEVATAQLPPSVESTSNGEGGETMSPRPRRWVHLSGGVRLRVSPG